MKKKVVFLMLIIVWLTALWSDDIAKLGERNEFALKGKAVPISYTKNDSLIPDPPAYDFAISPVDLGGTVYDYMPGSYCSIPIRVQPGFPQSNGIYITFHSQVSNNSKRRVNYAYIDANGNLLGNGNIATSDIREGFPSIAIDTVTGNPFVVYHLDADNDGVLDDNFSFDEYQMAFTPGLWLDPPFTLINNAHLQNIGLLDDGDEMIWPYVQMGSSPIEDKRRIYVSANNVKNSTGALNLPSENVLIAYADINTQDILDMAPVTWDWHYRKVQKFDDWHNEDPVFGRAQKTFLVKDNYVLYIGTLYLDGGNERMFALVNDNYGEGDFTYYEFDYETAWDNVDDIQLPDGSWFIGGDQEAQGVKWSAWADWNSHFNAIFRNETTVVFPGALQLVSHDQEQDADVYYPEMEMIYPKLFTFDIQTGQFGLEDVYPADPTPDNMPILPWDLNEDGIPDDGYDENGNLIYLHSFPMFNVDSGEAFNDCGFRITQNNEEGWEAIVWNDASEAFLQASGVSGYDDWANISKVMISVRNNSIGAWSTPIVIDAKEDDDNYNENIQGMMPCYIYPADMIQPIDETHGRVHLFFLNDDSFINPPNPDNCRLEYAAIDAEFEYPILSAESNQIAPNSQLSVYNYPNPFNPTTTIVFNSVSSAHVNITIYNLKGQLVKHTNIASSKIGKNKIVWNGKDDDNRTLSSGIYFYKIKQGKFTTTKKMILMK